MVFAAYHHRLCDWMFYRDLCIQPICDLFLFVGNANACDPLDQKNNCPCLCDRVSGNDGWLFKYVGSFILGVISTLSGAASFVLPYYESIGLNIKKAIGTTTVVVWLYSIFVLIFMIFLGLHEDKLPTGNIGFLNYQYLWLFTIPTIPGALLGAKLANMLPERKLRISFTGLLYVIGFSMLVS